jgi:exonuclease III
VKG